MINRVGVHRLCLPLPPFFFPYFYSSCLCWTIGRPVTSLLLLAVGASLLMDANTPKSLSQSLISYLFCFCACVLIWGSKENSVCCTYCKGPWGILWYTNKNWFHSIWFMMLVFQKCYTPIFCSFYVFVVCEYCIMNVGLLYCKYLQVLWLPW